MDRPREKPPTCATICISEKIDRQRCDGKEVRNNHGPFAELTIILLSLTLL